MREEIMWWWKQAEADLKAAKNSLASKDYHTSVFSTHQAVEKALKALYIPEYTLTRYPDASYGIPAERYTHELAEEYLNQAEEVLPWIKSQMKL